MSISKQDAYLLEIGTEVFCPLWEICNALCDGRGYERSDPKMLAHAQHILRRYLKAGWVEIHCDDADSVGSGSRGTRLIAEPKEIERIMNDQSNWVPMSFSEGGYGYVTTPGGEAVLKGHHEA